MRQKPNANDAQMAVQLIGQRSFKANRTTNWLIAFAAIIVIILITSTCSVFFNIQAFSNLQDLKSIGTTTDVIYSNPSSEQLAQLEENDLIQKPLYVSYKVGRLIGNIGQSGLSIDLYAVDNWDTWSSPLVSDFEGHYPTEADEVMMSTWLLKRFGIEPIVGTEITLSIGWDDYDVVQEETFHLSGFYTDTSYIDTASKQAVFLSTARLSEHQLPAEVAGFSFVSGSAQKNLNQIAGQIGLTDQQSIRVLSGQRVSILNQVVSLTDDIPAISRTSKIELAESLSEAKSSISKLSAFLTLVLFSIGILNFINTMSANILNRQREFAAMEAIGATKRQVKQLIVWEGFWYFASTMILALTIGSAADYFLFTVVRNTLQFGTFHYPVVPFVLYMLFALILCGVIPVTIYQKIGAGSIVQRLREN